MRTPSIGAASAAGSFASQPSCMMNGSRRQLTAKLSRR
jgi:hypothetical protein